jgi:D-alanyl-D-alanine carboxypeptidase-like protein/LysM domain-containing protein
MSSQYIVKRGDTLSKIAKRTYNDASLAKKLADFNGMQDENHLLVGQHLELPSRKELTGNPTANAPVVQPGPAATSAAAAPAPAPQLVTPNGLEQIIATFGDIRKFIRPDGTLDPRWEHEELGRAHLPFPIPLSWAPNTKATQIICHKKLVDIFVQVFTEIQKQGLADHVMRYGGCYNFRAKRTSSKLSAHCWGIAIDLNPETNAQGTNGNMNPGVIKIFQSFGFKWGGEFSGKSKDPMHFQFCTGY